MKQNIETFIGCDCEYEKAEIVLFGAPFDSTTSYRPGARFGSSANQPRRSGFSSPLSCFSVAHAAVVVGSTGAPMGVPLLDSTSNVWAVCPCSARDLIQRKDGGSMPTR